MKNKYKLVIILKKKIRSIKVTWNNYEESLNKRYTDIVSEVICNKLTVGYIEALLHKINNKIESKEYKTT